MSQRIRLSAGGVTLAALAAAAALLLQGPAWAARPGSGPELVFDGNGMFGMGCGAQANRATMTVPAESTVRVVNQTGRRAELLINGVAKGRLQDSQAADVRLHRGSVSMSVRPDCAVGGRRASAPVLVTAGPSPEMPVPSPSVTSSPEVTPQPSPSASTPPAPGVSPSASPSFSPPASSGPGDLGGQPGNEPRTGDHGTPSTTAGPTPVAGTVPRRPGRRAATEATQPEPVAPRRASAPATEGSSAALDPPRPAPAADRAGEAQPLAVQEVAEPVAMVPVTGTSPFALLVLVAGICVFGVGTGLIRTITSLRAFRT
ncbi:MAG TPA: hypothetical protein VF755_08040 [Catenuloplanes sp.]|jgi:hypothetical protein